MHGLRKPLLDPSFPRIDQILGEALRREDSLGDVITSGGFRRQREERCALYTNNKSTFCTLFTSREGAQSI